MKFITGNQNLTIKLEGWEMVWGLKRTLVVPKTSITQVRWQADYTFTGSMFRVAGTSAPRVLYAGYYHANGQRAYLFMRRPKGMSWTSGGIITAPDMLEITTSGFKYPLVLLTASQEDGQRVAQWASAV